MTTGNTSFEVEKIKPLALIDRLQTIITRLCPSRPQTDGIMIRR
jgi:hypothetical protein